MHNNDNFSTHILELCPQVFFFVRPCSPLLSNCLKTTHVFHRNLFTKLGEYWVRIERTRKIYHFLENEGLYCYSIFGSHTYCIFLSAFSCLASLCCTVSRFIFWLSNESQISRIYLFISLIGGESHFVSTFFKSRISSCST